MPIHERLQMGLDFSYFNIVAVSKIIISVAEMYQCSVEQLQLSFGSTDELTEHQRLLLQFVQEGDIGSYAALENKNVQVKTTNSNEEMVRWMNFVGYSPIPTHAKDDRVDLHVASLLQTDCAWKNIGGDARIQLDSKPFLSFTLGETVDHSESIPFNPEKAAKYKPQWHWIDARELSDGRRALMVQLQDGGTALIYEQLKPHTGMVLYADAMKVHQQFDSAKNLRVETRHRNEFNIPQARLPKTLTNTNQLNGLYITPPDHRPMRMDASSDFLTLHCDKQGFRAKQLAYLGASRSSCRQINGPYVIAIIENDGNVAKMKEVAWFGQRCFVPAN